MLDRGPRTREACRTVVHALRQRLDPDCLPVIASDGLALYFHALTAHFGSWVEAVGPKRRQWQVAAGLLYGRMKKAYRHRRLVRVSYQMLRGTREELKSVLWELGLSGKINTAFVERVNLTIRQCVAGLVRRTWSTAQKTPYLLANLEWWRAYYHFVRTHEALRVTLAQPIDRGGRRVQQHYRQRTPAMAAGLTNRLWTAKELLALPLGPEAMIAA